MDITPNKKPYEQAYYAPAPTGFTCYMRICFLWQIYRFFVINYKMLKLVVRSHQ